MTNSFDKYQFEEELEREYISNNFRLLYQSKGYKFPRIKLLQIFKAFKKILPNFEMSLADLKSHLDALSDAPDSGIRCKNDDEYFMEGA